MAVKIATEDADAALDAYLASIDSMDASNADATALDAYETARSIAFDVRGDALAIRDVLRDVKDTLGKGPIVQDEGYSLLYEEAIEYSDRVASAYFDLGAALIDVEEALTSNQLTTAKTAQDYAMSKAHYAISLGELYLRLLGTVNARLQ